MRALTAPSAESRIRVSEVSTSITLHWVTSRQTSSRDYWLVCFGVGLGSWLLAAQFDRPGLAVFLLAAVILAAWTLAGMHALLAVLTFFREPGPEKVILMDRQLRYIPSRVWSWDYVRRVVHSGTSELRVPLHELVSLRLEQTGNRQRLILDRATHWVEVGKVLTDLERTWLADAIGTWADSHRDRGAAVVLVHRGHACLSEIGVRDPSSALRAYRPDCQAPEFPSERRPQTPCSLAPSVTQTDESRETSASDASARRASDRARQGAQRSRTRMGGRDHRKMG